MKTLQLLGSALLLLSWPARLTAQGPSAADYPDIQKAIDANPGKLIYVPAGDYTINRTMNLPADNTGLWGPGRIIQTNANDSIVRTDKTSGVRVYDLTLTRLKSAESTTQEGFVANHCKELEVANVRVINNRSLAGGIVMRYCERGTIRDNLIRNYKRIALEDRTSNPFGGYAFKCIDGTGIVVVSGYGMCVAGNRVVEEDFLPTQAIQKQYELGNITKMNDPPTGIPEHIIKTRYTNNWHQGSGIIVSGLGHSARNQVINNQIEYPAQGIDIHADNVIIANNLISNAMLGMKAIHGSKNVIISGNQFINCDLASVWLMPGTASSEAKPASGNQPATPANTDGGHVVANNILTGMGHGPQVWNWGRGGDNKSAIAVGETQRKENPPLRNAIITGNLASDQEGTTQTLPGPPQYRYGLMIAQQGWGRPQNIVVGDNVWLPGESGAVNFDPKLRLVNPVALTQH